MAQKENHLLDSNLSLKRDRESRAILGSTYCIDDYDFPETCAESVPGPLVLRSATTMRKSKGEINLFSKGV